MYSPVGIQKLSPAQVSRLRNGHGVRVKEGSAHTVHLSEAQIKKLKAATRRGAAYTLILDAEQKTKHGSGLWGDISSKVKSLVRQNRDLINPIIGRARSYAKSGIQKLADKANAKVDQYTPEIQGEGIIGDILKGISTVAGMTGLGMKKRGRPRKILTEVVTIPKQVRVRKGKGILGNIIKAVAPAAIEGLAGLAKDKVAGMGVAKKKIGLGLKKVKKRKGGALYAAGYSGP
jgi:gas vesicle protein